MDHARTILEYIRSRDQANPTPSPCPFVTISRPAGAGGRTRARAVLKRLDDRAEDAWARGWEIYDYHLCAKIVSDPNLHASMEALLAEDGKQESWTFFRELWSGRNDQLMLNQRMLSFVRAVALRGKTIVGRAGNFATRDLGTGIHVRLVAPEGMRIKAMMDRLSRANRRPARRCSGRMRRVPVSSRSTSAATSTTRWPTTW